MKRIVLRKDLNLGCDKIFKKGEKGVLLEEGALLEVTRESIPIYISGKFNPIAYNEKFKVFIPDLDIINLKKGDFEEYFEFIKEEKENKIENKIITKEDNLKVIRNGKATIVILEDGTKGVSKCLEEDTYNESIGFEIAYKKAKIKQLTKELKKLSR